MNTITNISKVTETSGETPVITYSNRVTTTIGRRTPATSTRYFYCLPCGGCFGDGCCCDCCNSCCNCG